MTLKQPKTNNSKHSNYHVRRPQIKKAKKQTTLQIKIMLIMSLFKWFKNSKMMPKTITNKKFKNILKLM